MFVLLDGLISYLAQVLIIGAPEAFDVGVRADIAAQHPGLTGRMITELAAQDGIAAIDRPAAGALVVHAPGWDPDAQQRWLTAWLKTCVPFDR